jgi:hypothetical protein
MTVGKDRRMDMRIVSAAQRTHLEQKIPTINGGPPDEERLLRRCAPRNDETTEYEIWKYEIWTY